MALRVKARSVTEFDIQGIDRKNTIGKLRIQLKDGSSCMFSVTSLPLGLLDLKVDEQDEPEQMRAQKRFCLLTTYKLAQSDGNITSAWTETDFERVLSTVEYSTKIGRPLRKGDSLCLNLSYKTKDALLSLPAYVSKVLYDYPFSVEYSFDHPIEWVFAVE